MTLLGTLLRNSRPDERSYAWNQPILSAPETLEIASDDFADSSPLASRHAGSRVGGENLSPHLSWSEPPDGTAELLLLIEDLDSPLGKSPAVHCLAVIDEGGLQRPHELAAGALSRRNTGPGVTLLRSVIGRGYHGPEPVKGHGPHRYVFQVFALSGSLLSRPDRDALVKTPPRRLLASIDVPVLARGRVIGTYER
jgi:hypothetical protein